MKCLQYDSRLLVSIWKHFTPHNMWIAVVVISLALVAILFKYVLGGTPGTNPFAIDTREPLKPMVYDKTEE